MKLSTIIKFECLYNAKHIYNTLFFFLLIFQGIWYSTGFIDHIPNQNMMANAPAVAYGSLALMGIILFAVTPIIAAGSLARDLESGSAHIIYPAVIGEKKYFFGKYFGTLIVNFIVVLGYPLGILLFPLLGMGTPDQYGPMPIGQVLHAFLVLTVPNLIFLITFSIFLVVMFRRAAAAYLGVLLVFIILLVMLSVRNDTAYPLAVKLLEPFGCNCVEAIKENMDILQFNTAYLPISTPLFLNRLIWLTVSVLLFVVSLLRFNFKGFVALPGKTTKQEKVITESVMGIGNPVSLFLNYGTLSYHIRSVKFAMVNVRRIFTSPGFLVMLATLFFLFLGYNFLWTSTNYLTTSHLPLTYTMTLIRIPMMVVIGVMILILSGEVLFKDRISGLWTIVDAMPTPSWVLIISRFLTMGVVAFIIASLMFAAGVFAQCVMGFYGIEWGLYIRDLYGSRFGWVTSLQLISLAFFCGAFFNNRLKGHIVSIVIFIFIVMSVDQQLIEQQHLAFTIVPAALGPEMFNYSEMNGYGVLDTGMLWYAGAWTTLAVLFILLSVFLWNRGVDRSWKERWQTVKQRLGTSSGKGLGTAMICCLLLFGCFQYIIHDNLIHKAGYQTKIQKEEEAAAYEKKYARYRETRQPKITNLDLQLDLFPARRQAEYTARLVMKNTTSQPMETLHLDWDRKLAMSSLSADGHSLEKLEQDKKLRHAIYRMQPPLKAGESMNIEIVGSLAHRGFHQSDFQGDLTYNGSVLATDFLPFFGYDRSRELDNNKKRLRQGLALLTSRIDDRDNGFSRANLFESVQSDGLSWDMVISTDADQTVVGPGKLVKRWQDKGRNYARFQSASAGKIDFKIISARFAVKRLDCDGLGCVLFYHPQHTYNIAVFAEALQKIVPWFSGLLGSYPYKELRVVEKPFYDSDFLTFANVTAVSESRGWTADIKEEEDKQYIYLHLAEELARQWIGASLKAADVQGAELLTRSLASYGALRFIEKTWGREQTEKWLNKTYEDYKKEQSKEAIEEKNLLLVDKAAYISRDKGGLALYGLTQRVGAEKFDRWLAGWLAQARQKQDFLTSADFYADLREFVPENLHSFLRDWFEALVQYDLSIDDIQIKDGHLVLTISALKQEQGEKGATRELPFSMPLIVGLKNTSGKLQITRQINIQQGTNTSTITFDKAPASVTLDPYYWYLIENRKKCSKKL